MECTPGSCSNCRPGQYLEDSTCVDACADGSYQDEVNYRCISDIGDIMVQGNKHSDTHTYSYLHNITLVFESNIVFNDLQI